LDDPEFSTWQVPSKSVKEARCKLCRKNFYLSKYGKTGSQALILHASEKKTHIQHDVKVKTPSVSSSTVHLLLHLKLKIL